MFHIKCYYGKFEFNFSLYCTTGRNKNTEEEQVRLESTVWLANGSWHDAPQSGKVLLPDFVGHAHALSLTHIHTPSVRNTQAVQGRDIYFSQKKKHIQIAYVVNIHDRVTLYLK